MSRNQQIIRTSVVGIAANLFLAAFKAVVGWVAGSVAIIMDAVNNLSDALASVITIVGTKLSEKPADREHPFGYGRVEYFSAIIISVIVLSTGILSLVESVKKIFNPTHPSYTAVTLTIIIVAIVVKLVLGWYVKKQGKLLQSNALEASGADATFDAVVTLSTLVSAGIMLFTGLNLDGILGSIISLVIIKAGIEMIGASCGAAAWREHLQGDDGQHQERREAVRRRARCLRHHSQLLRSQCHHGITSCQRARIHDGQPHPRAHAIHYQTALRQIPHHRHGGHLCRL